MELLSFLPLILMIRSDFKERMIGIFPLIIFGVFVFLSGGFVHGWEESLFRVIANGTILLVLAGGVILYLSIKHGRGVNPLQGYFGSGDAWFLLCLTPSFRIVEYTWFLVLSFFFSLLADFLFSSRDKKKQDIPLVTTVGICYMFYLVYRLIIKM